MSILKLSIVAGLVLATAVGAAAQVCAFDDRACQSRRAEEMRRERIERLLGVGKADPSAAVRLRRPHTSDSGAAAPREARPHNEGARTRAVPTAPQ